MSISWGNIRAAGLLVIIALSHQGLYHSVQARSSGQGLDAACAAMLPFHTGLVPQTQPPPYTVVFDGESYNPGTPVTVTIRTCTATPFKGFMIQARRATSGSNQNEMLGSFKPVPGTQQACGGNGLLHTSGDPKTSLTFEWNPPASGQGPIQFRVTFVQDYRTVWAAVKSEVLKDGNNNFDPSTVTAATSVSSDCSNPIPQGPTNPVQTGDLTLPSGCGTSLGCVSKCSGSKCETVMSWQDGATSATYTISSTVSSSASFAAIGFSSDDKMGGDSVTGCASASDGTVTLFNAQNTGRKTPSMFEDNEVVLKKSSIADNVLSCTFERPKAESADGKRFAVSKKWVILFAKGSASVNGQSVSISYHSENKFVTASKYSSSDTPNVGGEDLEYPLIKVHGSLMVAAWVFLASIGILAARYYKPVWTEDLCSQKVWFQIHRTCMVLVFCTTVAGFVVIFLEVEDWSELIEDDEYLEYHPIMGVIVTALTVLNPLMAMFRPHPGTQNRPIFNWAHWFVGTAAHVLAVITIFFGVQLQKANTPDYMIYILAGYVAWQVFVELVLEIMQCCGRERARQELYEMDDMSNKKPEMKETAKTLSAKRVILLVHFFVLTVVTGIVIGFISIGEDDLD